MPAAIAALTWLDCRTVTDRERALAFAFSATAQIQPGRPAARARVPDPKAAAGRRRY